jgi:hypothetical protein
MYQNFKSMPTILRFITGHALACICLLLGSIIPHDSFSINGQPATYAEWWGSGAGILASILGIIFPIAGYLFLIRSNRARLIYLVGFFIAAISPLLYFGQIQIIEALGGIIFMAIFGWYLYKANSVQTYFES